MKKKNMTIQDKILMWMAKTEDCAVSKDDIPTLIAEGIVYSKRSFYDAMKNLKKKGHVLYENGRYFMTVSGDDYMYIKNGFHRYDACKNENDSNDSKLDESDSQLDDSDSNDSQPNVFADAYEKAMEAYKAAMDAYKAAMDVMHGI